MLEFIKSDDGDELYVYVDEKGWLDLQNLVEAARRSSHVHLMSKDWGGRELTITPGSTTSFNKVTITFEELGTSNA